MTLLGQSVRKVGIGLIDRSLLFCSGIVKTFDTAGSSIYTEPSCILRTRYVLLPKDKSSTLTKACTLTRERASMYYFRPWYADLDEHDHTMLNALFELAELCMRGIAARYQRQRVCRYLKLESSVACCWNGPPRHYVFALISATLHIFRTFLSRH